MTREELINQRATTCRHGGHCEWVACDKCNHYEPDALSQQPCDDCIRREEALMALTGDVTDCTVEEYIARLREKLSKLSSVTSKEKIGRWLHREDMDYLDENKVMHNHFMCKDCGFIHDFVDGHMAQYMYCPSCGAKMFEPQESEG